MYRVVILGGGGVLAKHLVRFFDVDGNRWVGRYLHLLTSQHCDITDWGSLSRAMIEYEPDLVINCAAFTNVALAETEKEIALRVNAVGAAKAALAARVSGANFIQVSTDYVFPGSQGPYSTEDAPLPINSYGLSKRLGEIGVLGVHPEARVVRVGWLFGVDYPSSAPMLAETENYHVEVRNVRAKHTAKIWDDLYGNPTHVDNAAERIEQVAFMLQTGFGPALPRVVHVGSEKAISWYEFLEGYDITPISSRSASVRRPQHGGLVPSKGFEVWEYGVALKHFQGEVARERLRRSKGPGQG